MDPIVNLDDPVGKIVGRRRVPNPLKTRPDEISASKKWREAGVGVRVPKGVFRFKSHEEADQWLMDHLTRKRES